MRGRVGWGEGVNDPTWTHPLLYKNPSFHLWLLCSINVYAPTKISLDKFKFAPPLSPGNSVHASNIVSSVTIEYGENMLWCNIIKAMITLISLLLFIILEWRWGRLGVGDRGSHVTLHCNFQSIYSNVYTYSILNEARDCTEPLFDSLVLLAEMRS